MIPALMRLLNEVAGLQLSAAQQQQAQIKLTQLARREGFSEPWSLLRAAQQNPQLAQTIAASFTVSETFYYRGASQLHALQETFFAPLQTTSPREVRLWSAGCSTGEEAYTLASLAETALPAARGWQVQVLGTDINEEALSKARAATYSEWSFRGVAETQRQIDFVPTGSGWQVRPALRQRVTFKPHNLRHAPPWSRVDLILCRNVLIYFDGAGVRQVYRHLFAALRPGGLLLTAPTDPRPPAGSGLEPLRSDLVGLWRRPALPTSSAPTSPAAERHSAAGASSPSPLSKLPRSPAGSPLSSPSVKPLPARPTPNELEQARQMVYHSPDDPFAHFTLALALLQAQQRPRARSSVAQALALLRGLPQDTSFPDGLTHRQLHERLLALQTRLHEAR